MPLQQGKRSFRDTWRVGAVTQVDVDELDMETFNKVMAWAQQKTKAVKNES